MKELSNVGLDIPSNHENFINLDSINSLSATDIAVFSPNMRLTDYSTYGADNYEGKVLYNKESSSKIIDHIKHWNTELLDFVKNGGTLFIILCKKEDFFIYTGSKTFSGTGKNRQTTNEVKSCTNYDFLPFRSSIEFYSANGKTVIPNSSLVTNLYLNSKNYFSFETYIKGEKITNSIFTTRNKDRILGTSLKFDEGFVIFIPSISFDLPKFTKYIEKTHKSIWTSEAIKAGKIFINSLVEIDKALRKAEDKTPKPTWLQNGDFNLSAAIKTESLIKGNEKEILKKEKENESLKKILEEQESLKDLLFESGEQLENAVTKALHILGYKAENYNDGELELDQIILSPEGERFIGECEGKDTKDIDVSKFRQLLDGLNADFEKETVVEKAFGLLIGNPQRLINPMERTLSFTQKCLTGAEREKIGLIKTQDLFMVCRHIIENNDKNFALKCRKAILGQLGKIIEFPKP